MGKGSKPPANTTSTVTQSSIPEYARPYFENLLNATQSEVGRPYQPYAGPRISGFDPSQTASFGGIRSLNALGNPTTDTAAQGAAGIYNPAMAYGNFQADHTSTNMFPGQDISGYMNPYIENVMNRMQDSTQRNFRESQGQRDTSAERAHAYGGSRQTIADIMARRNLDTQLGDQQANLLNQGYQQAVGQWTSDQGRRLASDQGNQQAGIQGAQVGVQGLNTGLQSAQMLGQLGAQQQQLAMQRLGALQDVGKQGQQLQQSSLDQAYQDFVNQRDYGRNNLSFLSGILHGIPVQPESSVIQYAPSPNALSSALGSGISALALSKSLGSTGTGTGGTA